MKGYQSILVCIDEPDRDCRMLDYAGAICRVAETKEIHLLHVKSGKAPSSGGAGSGTTESAEVTPDMLQALAAEHLKGHGKEQLICQVVIGSPLIEILRYALDKEVDLIVVGRESGSRQEMERKGVMARRVTRKATCSVLVLPEGSRTKADKILVPVHDSECSANAANSACRIAAVIDGTVCCLNVFRVGSGYSRVGSTLEEHISLLYKHAQHECERLLLGVDSGGVKVVTKCVPDLYSQPVSVILNEIENESADMVVIGARGRTRVAGVFLGNVTERLIRQSTVPVLAVKKKGECLGILQALLIVAG